MIARLARAFSWRGGWRALVFPLVAFVPFLLVMTGLTAASAITTTAEEAVAGMGGPDAGFQLLDEAGAPADDRGSLDRAVATVAAVAPIVRVDIETEQIVRSGTAIGVVRLLDSDWSRYTGTLQYRIIDGRVPTAAGEVVLARPTAADLGARVGATLQIGTGRTPARVVGLALARTGHQARFVMAGPGTWWTLERTPTQPASVTLRVSREDAPQVAEALGQSPSDDATAAVDEFGAPLPFYLEQALLILLPVVLAVSVALGALVLIRFRRLGSDLAVAAGLGLRDGQVRLLAIAAHLGTVVPAIVAGSLLGVLVGRLVAPWLAAAADRDAAVHGFPMLELLTVVAVGTAVTAAIAALAAGRVVRELRAGAAARPASDTLTVGRPGWRRPVVVAALGALAIVVGLNGPAEEPDSINSAGSLLLLAGGIVICAAAAVLLPTALAAAARRSGAAVRFPLVQTSRDRGRASGVLVVVLIAVALPLSVQVNQASFQRLVEVAYHPTMPPGQIDIDPGQELSRDALAEIEQAAGAPVVALPALGDPSSGRAIAPWWNLLMDDPSDPYQTILVIDSPAVLTSVSGYLPTESDVTGLRAGAVLVFRGNPISPGAMMLLTDSGEGPRRTVDVQKAAGAVDSFTSTAFAAVVLRDAFDMAGDVQPVPAFHRVLGGADRVETVRGVAAAYGFAPYLVTVDEPFPQRRNVSAQLTLWIGYLLGGLLVVILVGGLLRERTRDLSLLSALGARRRIVGVAAAGLAGVPVALGALAGVGAGVLGGWISFVPPMIQRDDAVLVVPLSAALLGGVGAVALAALVALAKARTVSPRGV